MVNKIIFWIVFYSLVSIISGCASMRGFPERSNDVASQLRDLKSKYFHPDAAASGGKMTSYNSETDESRRKAIRNEIVYNRLLAYDLQFSVFQEALYQEGILSNLSLDILGVGVGAAGGVVTTATTSRILSALSGGIAGSKTAINKNLYYERTLPALLSLMIANREKIKAVIFEGLQQEDTIYPLGHALADLERYYIAGSIPGAIASVNEEAGKTQAAAQIVFEKVRDKAFVDVSAQRRIDSLLDAVDKLESGMARKILEKPPVKLSSSVKAMITGSRGPASLKDLKEDDAKSILKRVLVLVGRNKEGLDAWEAAVIADKAPANK